MALSLPLAAGFPGAGALLGAASLWLFLRPDFVRFKAVNQHLVHRDSKAFGLFDIQTGLIFFPFNYVSHGAVIVGFAKFGVDIDGAAEITDGLVKILLITISNPPVIIGLDRLGIRLSASLKAVMA